MADNKKMQNAKAVKNDEFFTEYNTIANEVGHYRSQMTGQVVYCNCDDPTWSNFWKYFHSNFASLGLKKLISTHYNKQDGPSYAMIYEGGDDFNLDVGTIVLIEENDRYHAGDFRSDACMKFLEEATLVATNPPFSLFREYIAQLIEYEKKFIVLGNQNASHNKDIFPLFKENKIWYGASIHSGGVDFRMPDDYEEYSSNVFLKDGRHYINLAGIRWFTNLDVKYRHDGLWHKNGKFDNTQAHCYYEGNEDKYPSYANFDGIDVASSKNIPIDYIGNMGVPVTILDHYNPEEFELVGIGSGTSGQNIGIRGIAPEHKKMMKGHSAAGDLYYILPNGRPKVPFSRIIVRNLNPIKKSDDLGY